MKRLRHFLIRISVLSLILLGAANGADALTISNFDSVTLSQISPPVADFSAVPLSGTAPLAVSFTDLSTGNPTAWNWSFGDGVASTAQDPNHQYTDPGTYSVSLTASNTSGSDTKTKTNYITANSGGSKEYTCASAVIDIGSLKSGAYTNTYSSNDNYLTVASAKSGNKQAEQVTYSFSTGLGGSRP